MPSQGIVISLSLWDAKFIEAVGAKDLPVTHTPKLLVQLNKLPISDVFYVIGMIQVFNVALSYIPFIFQIPWSLFCSILPFCSGTEISTERVAIFGSISPVLGDMLPQYRVVERVGTVERCSWTVVCLVFELFFTVLWLLGVRVRASGNFSLLF
ncbi:hypothetical protein FRB95_009913 [Tulasnella sp. JGI-2019a]|nr:hypothetical protein FRB95_009913 [Tulasnella sp. JGI-2019a]